MGFKQNLLQFFTWWNGSTWGTRFHLWRNGTRAGSDEFGNVYYTSKSGRRYVQYAGEADPTTVPPGWSGWMHYRTDITPEESDYVRREWELPHQPNLTGTARAYRPQGSLLSGTTRPEVVGDYDAWTP